MTPHSRVLRLAAAALWCLAASAHADDRILLDDPGVLIPLPLGWTVHKRPGTAVLTPSTRIGTAGTAPELTISARKPARNGADLDAFWAELKASIAGPDARVTEEGGTRIAGIPAYFIVTARERPEAEPELTETFAFLTGDTACVASFRASLSDFRALLPAAEAVVHALERAPAGRPESGNANNPPSGPDADIMRR